MNVNNNKSTLATLDSSQLAKEIAEFEESNIKNFL